MHAIFGVDSVQEYLQQLFALWPALVIAIPFGLLGVGVFELEQRDPDLHRKIGDSF